MSFHRYSSHCNFDPLEAMKAIFLNVKTLTTDMSSCTPAKILQLPKTNLEGIYGDIFHPQTGGIVFKVRSVVLSCCKNCRWPRIFSLRNVQDTTKKLDESKEGIR